MNIIRAINDENLFQPVLGDLNSWKSWLTALRVLYGLDLSPKRQGLLDRCTGRHIDSFPENGFDEVLFLTGRRSGKSKIAAVIGAFEAALSGRERLLSRGERGIVTIVSPTIKQSTIVKDYIRAIFLTDLLRPEVIAETKDEFQLANGVEIWIMAGDWRTIRGFTLLAAIVDEVCFFGYDAECKVKSDTELIRAIKLALATVRGKLICISSPYAKKGWSYKKFQNGFGNNNSRTLVWNAPSKLMNPTLAQSIIDEAMEDDLAAAKSEYLGQWREDIAEYIPRSLS